MFDRHSIFLHRCKQMILQYVVVKPLLAAAVFITTLTDTYEEGSFAVNGGYLWVTLVYNISITVSFSRAICVFTRSWLLFHLHRSLDLSLLPRALL